MSIETPPMKELTARQIGIVKENWKFLNKTPRESGQAIFHTFLTRHPEHHHLYTTMNTIPLEELKDTPQIHRHCAKIMNFFSIAVNALGDDSKKDVLVKAITDNAEYHGKKGIAKENFNQLRDVILEVVAGACNLDDEGKQAWVDLMDVIHHVSFNILDELKK